MPFFCIHISQSSVATRLRRGGIFKYEFVANFLLSRLVKLWPRVWCLVFLTHCVQTETARTGFDRQRADVLTGFVGVLGRQICSRLNTSAVRKTGRFFGHCLGPSDRLVSVQHARWRHVNALKHVVAEARVLPVERRHLARRLRTTTDIEQINI